MKRFKNEKYNALPPIERVLNVETNGDSTKLTIYGDIGESFFDEGISAKQVENTLKSVTTSTIDVHINSYGGDVFDGLTIYRLLKDHTAKVVVHIDGLAASAASLIAQAGDEIIMNIGSMLMIHEGSTFAFGTKSDLKKTLGALEGIDKSIADVYMERFTGSREDIDAMIVAETWFTASEAITNGLADNAVTKPVEDGEITNLKTLVYNLTNEVNQLKQPVEPVKVSAANNFFLNLN